MIYLRKDGTGYQVFPVPTDMTGYLAVGGTTEQRIKAGDPYRLLNDGQVIEFWTPQEVAAERLAEAKLAKRDELNAAMLAERRGGLTWTFPELGNGVIQTRDASDRANIVELGISAQENPNDTFLFRDAENRVHTLTGDQVLALAWEVRTWLRDLQTQVWTLKDQVAAATTLAEVEAITWE